MLKAVGTGILGAGVTLTSTFAASLGLSVQQQRIGFVLGAVLMLAGIFLLFSGHWHRRGRRAESSPMTELEKWLQSRIVRAEELERQRPVRGDDWYIAEMGKWDFENVQRMHDGDDPLAPDLVLSYREDPRSGHTDGIYPPHDMPEHERYYRQRLAWIRNTLDRLGKGEGPSEEAAERRRLVRVEAEVALIHEEANEMVGLLKKEWPYIGVDGAVVQTALPSWKAKLQAAQACRHRLRWP